MDSSNTITRKKMLQLTTSTIVMISTWGVGCGKKLTSVDVDIDEDVYGEREWVNAKDVMSIKEKMKSLPKWSAAHKICYMQLNPNANKTI